MTTDRVRIPTYLRLTMGTLLTVLRLAAGLKSIILSGFRLSGGSIAITSDILDL
jgi:hypothetical protein